MSKRNTVKIGGVWKNTSETGQVYYSGNITKFLKVLIYKNDFKQPGDKQPDFNVYLSDSTGGLQDSSDDTNSEL